MKRRNFLYGSLTGFVASSAVAASETGNAFTSRSNKNLIVCFRSGTADAMAEDGSWNICVLADPRNSQRPDVIRLKFQVATDDTFSELLFDERYFARKANSYLLYINYKPKEERDDLHYRFIALDAPRRDIGTRGQTDFQSTLVKRLRRA